MSSLRFASWFWVFAPFQLRLRRWLAMPRRARSGPLAPLARDGKPTKKNTDFNRHPGTLRTPGRPRSKFQSLVSITGSLSSGPGLRFGPDLLRWLAWTSHFVANLRGGQNPSPSAEEPRRPGHNPQFLPRAVSDQTSRSSDVRGTNLGFP